MYFFYLNMSKHSPRSVLKNVILKNSAELTGKQLRAGVSFIMRVQAAWIESNFTFTFYLVQVFSSEICKIFKSAFENTNNSV